jgi:hypothetical protein
MGLLSQINGTDGKTTPRISGASANDDQWQSYLDANPDVQAFWSNNTNNVRTQYKNPLDWAQAHYYQNGQAEGRPMGQAPQPPSVQDQWNQAQQMVPQQSNPLIDALAQRVIGPDGQLTQASVSANDPNIRAQVDAYSAEQERARRLYLQQVAEGAGPYDNIRGEQRASAETLGQNVGGFEAALMGRELESQRAQLSQYLQLYGASLSEQQRNQLQTQLALLEQQTQGSQFSRQLQLQAESQAAYYDAVRRGLFRAE